MKFTDLLVTKTIINESNDKTNKKPEKQKNTINSPEQLLRNSGFKIKMVIPTTFGVQIDFAKKYEENSLQTILKDYNIKIKDKSVFIVY